MTPWEWKLCEPDWWSTGWGPLTLDVFYGENSWVWKVKIAREVSDWEVIGEGTCVSQQEAQVNAERFAANWVLA